MKQTKSGVSSLLKEDFGIEDFVAGNYTSHNSSAFGLEDVALANQLGLLASFKDYDTTSDTFSMEAYNLLGESDQIGLFAAQGMENAANQFSVLANIKKEFGVEGFDPLTYGAEGFIDTVKKAWSWLVAAFKKLIQSVSNFIRGVMNFVGGIVAKTQSGLVDKYKNLKATDPSVGKRVKGMIPKKDLSKELSDYNKGLAKSVLSLESHIESVEDIINSNLEGIPTYTLDKKGKFSEMTYKKLSLELAKYLKLPGGNLEDSNPAKEAKRIVFGIDAIVQEYPPSKYLEGDQWKTVLSKDFLNKMKEFVSDGKKLIKMFQTALKSIESVQKRLIAIQNNEIDNKDRGDLKKSEKKKEIKSKKKGVAGQMKKTRDAISQLTHYRNFAGKTTGILYGVYANCLKARSYYAAALRSYAAAAKPAKGSKKAKEEKAFKERNGLS